MMVNAKRVSGLSAATPDRKPKDTFLKTALQVIPIQFKSTPVHNVINILVGMILALTLTTNVIATQNFFDVITDAAAGHAVLWGCVIPLLVLAGSIFGSEIANGILNFQADVIFKKSAGKIRTALHRKLQRIDPAQFEDTDFLDELNKASEGVSVIPYFCMSLFIMVSFFAMYFVLVGTYLFSLKPLLLVTLLLAFIPAMLGQIMCVQVFSKLEKESAPLRREFEYYQKTLCDREYFKETRILGAFRFFHLLFEETMMIFTKKQWRAERKTALLQLTLNTTTFAGMGIASYLLFTATITGEISVGTFAAVFAALRAIFSIMQQIVNGHIGNMNRNLGKVANFIRLLNMPERVGSDGIPNFSQGVVAEGVSFTYRGRETPAVKGVSLSIKSGETIAIVGENGAGKSTLVRLLTGIYRPSEGKVTVGGLDTTVTSPTLMFKGISGVFQKYQRYKMTLGENIAISDPEGMGSGFDPARIKIALHEAGTEMDNITLDTMLSPEYDGIDLSGGQWQRLAIARGLYRSNGFIILDEPTAAIDPMEETRVYMQFQKLAEGKCAIVVTHRLGSAKLAHRIVVMDAGEIVDTGTHDELLARPGKYADMWAVQAQWYERKEK